MVQTLRLPVSEASLQRAVALLMAGELVAFPTETVYGLGARADQQAPVLKIFEAKGRPADKPLIVHVAGIREARDVTASWPAQAQRLAAAFWPGPLTLVLPKASAVPSAITAGGATVAVRAPAHPAAIALLQRCPFSIAAPSANLSGQPPPIDANAVSAGLDARIAMILDGGATTVQVPSTIVDLSHPDGRARLLRAGGTPTRALKDLVALITEAVDVAVDQGGGAPP